jgi:hypothetical protein
MMNGLPDFISNLPIGIQYLIAVLLVIAAIWSPISLFLVLGKRMFKKLWPNRENWKGNCMPLEPTDKHYGDDRLIPSRAWGQGNGRWCQMRAMRVGDYFHLDMNKARVISRIVFDCQTGFPLRSKLELRKDKDSDFEVVREILGKIDVKLDRPQKFTELRITILEPKTIDGPTPAWSIYDIRLVEVRLFGKFWNSNIN